MINEEQLNQDAHNLGEKLILEASTEQRLSTSALSCS